jgi:hypothetical protein
MAQGQVKKAGSQLLKSAKKPQNTKLTKGGMSALRKANSSESIQGEEYNDKERPIEAGGRGFGGGADGRRLRNILIGRMSLRLRRGRRRWGGRVGRVMLDGLPC